jgi:hypothetical protein
MINKERCLILDIDGTLCPTRKPEENYEDLIPHSDMLELIRAYKTNGFYLILHSSRNMNSFEGNLGKITAHTGKTLMKWLDQHQIPYDEIHLGKPWPGKGGFYVDDKAIRPSEFRRLSYVEILELLKEEEFSS